MALSFMAANAPGSAIKYSSDDIRTTIITEQPQYQAVEFEKYKYDDPKLKSLLNNNGGTLSGEKSQLTGMYHPALGDNGSDTLLRGFEYYDGVETSSYVFWNGSDDNGSFWTLCCYLDLRGGSYPSVDY